MIATFLLIGFGAAVVAGFCYALVLCGITSSADTRMERLVGDELERAIRRVAPTRTLTRS
jgi:hypothetical protein